MQEEVSSAMAVPAEAVINTLVRSGAATQAEVQLAAELVGARMEINQLKERLQASEGEQQQSDRQPKGGRPEK